MSKPFIRPEGHNCKISTHIFDCLTFGNGRLDDNGTWEHGCEVCARAHEEQFPDEGPCWPHTDEQLRKMGLLKEGQTRDCLRKKEEEHEAKKAKRGRRRDE